MDPIAWNSGEEIGWNSAEAVAWVLEPVELPVGAVGVSLGSSGFSAALEPASYAAALGASGFSASLED